MIDTKEKIIIKFKTDKILDLIDDTKKPMSLNEIMSKYDVSYPFTVKCVKDFYTTRTGEYRGLKGKVLTYIKDSINGPDYANSIQDKGHGQNKSSKKFILWE